MKRTKVSSDGSKEFKPSPNLDLRGKVGNKVIGILKKRIESAAYPGKFTAIIEVEFTDGDTTLNREPVDIDAGDSVFLSESTVLGNAFSKIQIGQKVEVVYLGKGKAKAGRKAPYLYDVFVLEEVS